MEARPGTTRDAAVPAKAPAPLPPGEADQLQEQLLGPVITAGRRGYEDARRLYNASVEHRPAAIAQVTGSADVAAAVRFGREHDLDISVRGGAHGITGYAMAGQLVIDLSRMRETDVDPGARTVRVGGGALWGDVDGATQEHGLATPGGRVSNTGVGGLTLGGGQGWLSSKYGLTIDNLLEVELVTAEGETVTASKTSEPELFWGLRGAGTNFGVASRFTFQLHEVGPEILGGMLIYSPDRAGDLVAFYNEFLATAPDDLGSGLAFVSAPSAPFVPPEAVGTPIVAILLGWFGDPAEGERAIAPLRAFGQPMMDLVGPMPYLALQSLLDEGNPAGLRNYWSAAYLPALTDDFIHDTVDIAIERPSTLSELLIAPMGEPARRVPEDETSFGHREARFLYHPMAKWVDPAQDAANISWARQAMTAASPHASAGTYLNVDGGQTSAERVRFAFGEEQFRRLVDLKRVWDPDNVFRHTANIDPADLN